VARAAKINDGGSLTLVSGFLSRRPSAGSVLQGAIHAALEGLVRGFALEFAKIRVNAVSPALIDTPLYSKLGKEQRRKLYENTKQQLWAELETRRCGQSNAFCHDQSFRDRLRGDDRRRGGQSREQDDKTATELRIACGVSKFYSLSYWPRSRSCGTW
jgi:NAD(P)-dependent dehydrogenase (short-subunit alcohol dehydrogenase family)